MTIQPRGRLAVDRGIQHPAPGRAGLTGEHEQAGGIAADPVADVGETLEVLVGRQLPVRAQRLGIDPAAELAERGVGVDGDHPVLPQLREHRTDRGGHGGLAYPTLLVGNSEDSGL